jgi:ACS family glucarate transporter-like MFS transporter
MALVFVGINALVAAISYLFVVGEIKRIELKGLPSGGGDAIHLDANTTVHADLMNPTTKKV